MLALFFFLSPVRAQSISNEGTEFYAIFPTHVNAPDYAQNVIVRNNFAEYSIFITGSQPSTGIVSVNGTNIRFNLAQGNTVVEVKVPRSAAYINESERNQVLSNRAIRVIVDPGKPKVVTYGHIFAGRRSAASLVLPKDALGQDYYTMNQEVGAAGGGGANYIAIAAVDPDTRIFIQKDGKDLVSGGVLLRNTGDVYQYLSPDDLTGTHVFVDPQTSACKKFALFSGTTNASITPPGMSCINPNSLSPSSDPLYQQNYPVESWGKNYGFVPFSSRSPSGASVRTRGNYIRILAKEDNTPIQFNGLTVATLNAGQFYQTNSPINSPTYISSTKAIAAAQYALSQACAGGGVSDPDMVILNPIEYNIKNITVYSSNKEAISENYVNVLIKTSAASSFRVNGAVPRGNFTALPGSAGLSYMQLNLNQYSTQIFNLSASDGFNAIAYGFGDVESYAYSAGTNLASNQTAIAESTDTKEKIENACSKEPFNVKVTLTSPVSSLSWQFEPNGPVELQNITTSLPVVRNGTTYYDYYFSRTISYPVPGKKSIKVVAKYPSIGGCALNEQQIDLNLEVFDPPIAKFKTSTTFCAMSEIQFTDESIDNGNSITKWSWDFGDGKVSAKQNPTHVFAGPGVYPVKLKVENSTSCDVAEYEQVITVNTIPEASFTASKPGCNNTSITFTDKSIITSGNIVKWTWDFGDGNKQERVSNLPFDYKYAAGGNFEVSLTVTSNTGCENTITQTTNVTTPTLEAGDDLVMIRGGSVNFNIQASGTNLRYKWSPAIGLDRNDVKNPVASPTENTRYTVIVTSDEGCVLSDEINVLIVDKPIIRNTFTPNGDGVNDVWEIDYLDSYPEASVDIFNRFGVKVYTSIGYKSPWNGTLNGDMLPVGTYYYVIDPKLGIPVYTGWVTILR
ncbi:MAG: PKD domain-containing protein [Daejeonella sp.]|uniref:PKD domain-containing protein n=1 Tax=Daejeonella sp. TaxID=2805397 RepID=UPI003C713FCB